MGFQVATDGSDDGDICCLKPEDMAAKAVSRIAWLTSELSDDSSNPYLNDGEQDLTC